MPERTYTEIHLTKGHSTSWTFTVESINFDIKYRMGRGADGGEEGE